MFAQNSRERDDFLREDTSDGIKATSPVADDEDEEDRSRLEKFTEERVRDLLSADDSFQCPP